MRLFTSFTEPAAVDLLPDFMGSGMLRRTIGFRRNWIEFIYSNLSISKKILKKSTLISKW